MDYRLFYPMTFLIEPSIPPMFYHGYLFFEKRSIPLDKNMQQPNTYSIEQEEYYVHNQNRKKKHRPMFFCDIFCKVWNEIFRTLWSRLKRGSFEMKYEIRKSGNSTNPWWVWYIEAKEYPHEQAVCGSGTKKEAQMLLDLLSADNLPDIKKAAQSWYRFAWSRAIKKYGPDAKRYIVYSCISMGLTPEIVNANKDTAEPL